jgi:hypothetical protein
MSGANGPSARGPSARSPTVRRAKERLARDGFTVVEWWPGRRHHRILVERDGRRHTCTLGVNNPDEVAVVNMMLQQARRGTRGDG